MNAKGADEDPTASHKPTVRTTITKLGSLRWQSN